MKILFATDGSANAQQAATFLSKIDFSTRYELIIATVSYDPTLATNDYFAWAEEWRQQEAQRVEASHDEIVETLNGKPKSVKRVHRIGTPQRELLKIATEQSVDLIVIGAVGHSAIRRLVLGSISDHVATHADCSVLVVRPHELQSDEPLERILVGYDGSKPAQSLLEELSTYGLATDAQVSIATVLEEYDYMLGDPIAESLYKRQCDWFNEQRDDNHRMVTKLVERFPNAHSVIQKGASPDNTLVSIAERSDSQMVMIGDAGHTFWDDLMMGSTTKDVLRHAPCSVWISRHHRDVAKSANQEPSETANV